MNKDNNKKYLLKYRKQLRNNPTNSEEVLWSYLQKSRLGVKFRRQHSINNYILDFYAPSISLCIELDGITHDSVIEKDELRDKELKSLNVKVLRFDDEEVFYNLESVLIVIEEQIKKSKAIYV